MVSVHRSEYIIILWDGYQYQIVHCCTYCNNGVYEQHTAAHIVITAYMNNIQLHIL